MTRLTNAFAGVLAGVALLSAAPANVGRAASNVGRGFSPGNQQQTFRTSTDAVMVDASVRSGGKMVADLTAADFVLTDNGVRQSIDSVEHSAVPIDLTIVVDTSGNPARPWRSSALDRRSVLHEIMVTVQQVKNQLRPTDRIRVLANDRYVRQIAAFTPVSVPLSYRLVEIDGLGSIYDTLTAAMLHAVEPWRRHIVVVSTKGHDSMSATTAEAVAGVAEKSDALVHLVIDENAVRVENTAAAFAGGEGMFKSPAIRYWAPARHELVNGEFPVPTPEGLIVQAGLRASGGEWYQSEGFSEPSLRGTFKRVFDDYRQGYVLRYTPKGVTPSGWHTIEVTVPKIRNARVTARRGYGIEPPRVTPSVALPAVPQTLPEFIATYDQFAFDRTAAGFRRAADPTRLLKDFEVVGNPWPAKPRREAAFAIELSEAGVFSTQASLRGQAEAMLTRFAKLVRHPFEPDEFERRWNYTLLALLQGTYRPGTIESFARRALARFPDDPQFRLAMAIAMDMHTAAGGVLRWSAPTPAGRLTLDAAGRQFEALLNSNVPDVASEARVRLAFVLQRQGQNDAALARLDEAAPPSRLVDPHLAYLHHLFRGRLLEALGRLDEAMAAYRAARTLQPNAQSGRVSMANLAYRLGDRALAESLVEEVQTDPGAAVDPWWLYWQGQYRLYPQLIAGLREMAR